MADPLSIIGGIAAILQIASEIVKLIKAAKEANNNRQRLLAEIKATTAVCLTLKDYADIDATPWTTTFQSLCQIDGGPVQ